MSFTFLHFLLCFRLVFSLVFLTLISPKTKQGVCPGSYCYKLQCQFQFCSLTDIRHGKIIVMHPKEYFKSKKSLKIIGTEKVQFFAQKEVQVFLFQHLYKDGFPNFPTLFFNSEHLSIPRLCRCRQI